MKQEMKQTADALDPSTVAEIQAVVQRIQAIVLKPSKTICTESGGQQGSREPKMRNAAQGFLNANVWD